MSSDGPRRLTVALSAVLLLALALVPRIALVGETAGGLPQWRVRAERFWNALEEGRLRDTLVAPHPGLTVLWLSGASMAVSGAESEPDRLDAATIPIAVLGALLAVAAALLLLRLLRDEGATAPVATALVAGLLLALDPLLLLMHGLLCLDGLLASLFLVAVLAGAHHVRSPSRTTLLAAAALTGLCVATKAAGLLLVPVFLLLPGVPLRRRLLDRDRWTLAAAALGGAVAIPVLLLPACWVDPVSTFRTLVLGGDPAGSLVEAISGKHPDVFFLGEATRKPGVLFYPVDLLFRATPLAILGALVAVPLVRRRTSAATVGLAVLVVLVGLTLADKKNWRYTSLAIPILDVLAAIGIVALAVRIAKRGRAKAVAVGVVALLVAQVVWVTASGPRYGLAFNPAAGGPGVAARAVGIGWGEGLEEAIGFLEREAEARGDPVTWSGGYRQPYGVVGSEFASDRVRWIGRNPKGIRADYHVLYVAYGQRGEARMRETDRWWHEHGVVVHRVVDRGIELATVLARKER